MSYHIYTTKGIVLSERSIGEADRIYSIITRELGKVHARAIGVRKGESKLRGNLEPLSLSSVSFVRGKDFWRITSAELLKKLPVTEDIIKPLLLLDKLIQGEDPNIELFDALEESMENTHDPEVVLVSKILYHLGYLQEADLSLNRSDLIKAINRGLQASHLA